MLTLKPKVGRGKASIVLRPVDLRPKVSTVMPTTETPEQEEERHARNHRRSVMRSRGLLMDYAREYKLCYLWTLTYKGEGQHDWDAMVDDVREFQRRFKEQYPDMAYVIVPEWHPGGHGIHLHMGVGRFIPWQVMLFLWTDGGSHPLAGTVKAPKTVKGKIDPEHCARYLAKYVTKTLNDAVARRGAKRFYRPHGHVVTLVRWRFTTELRAYTFALLFFGGELPYEWDSRLAEGWEGPPLIALDWNRARGVKR